MELDHKKSLSSLKSTKPRNVVLPAMMSRQNSGGGKHAQTKRKSSRLEKRFLLHELDASQPYADRTS